MSLNNEKTIIVGGGIAGLTAAGLLAEKGDDVVLLERGPQPGGLLGSYRSETGEIFDYGTHYALSSGIDRVDRLLFTDIPGVEFRRFHASLPEGNYWAGKLNSDSGCIDVRSLPGINLARTRDEFLSVPGSVDDPGSAADYLYARFGKTITDDVYRPVLGKLVGRRLEELDAHTVAQMSLSRVILFDSDAAIELKKNPNIDERLAFVNRCHGSSSILKYYPIIGGIGAWVDGLVLKLRKLGVQILTDCGPLEMVRGLGRVASISLSDGQQFDVADLIWTGSVDALLSCLGAESQLPPPGFRDLALFHLVSDSPFETDLHWVCNYDPEYLVYRVTLYPNITGRRTTTGKWNVTCEILLSQDAEIPDTTTVVNSLSKMGLIAPSANMEAVGIQRLRRAMPIFPPGALQSKQAQRDQVRELVSNVVLAGSASGYFHQIPMLRQLVSEL